MKYTDITLTRTQYNAHSANKQGQFRPPLDFIKKQGYDQNNITEAQLDLAFDIYKHTAYNDINAFHVQRPLNKITYQGLSQDIKDGLANALVAQINNALQNGLAERINTSSNSVSAFSQTLESNVKVNTKGQIDQDTEDALDDIDYLKWKVTIKNGIVTITFGNLQPYVSMTMNGYALEAMNFINDNPSDLDFPSMEIMKKAIASNNKALGFLGTWDAPSSADVDNIDRIFQAQGLILTDGTTLTPANTQALGTIIVSVSSDATFLNEEKYFDTTWKDLTFNNAEFEALNRIIAALETLDGRVEKLEDNYAELVAQLRKIVTDQATENTRLAALIQTNATEVLSASNVANNALAVATAADTRAQNNEADIAELNLGKFDFDGTGNNVIEIFDANGVLKQSIKDLTHLTTQDELYNAAELGKTYLIKNVGRQAIIFITAKSLTEMDAGGVSAFGSTQEAMSVKCIKGINTPYTVVLAPLSVKTPTDDIHATTKKYVDDAIAALAAKMGK